MRCCVPFCGADTRYKGTTCSNVSYHEFPVDEPRRSIWIKVVSREWEGIESNWIPQCRTVICSRHFMATDFRTDTKNKILKSNSIPSIFKDKPRPRQRRYSPRTKKAKVRNSQNQSKKKLLKCASSKEHPEIFASSEKQDKLTLDLADIFLDTSNKQDLVKVEDEDEGSLFIPEIILNSTSDEPDVVKSENIETSGTLLNSTFHGRSLVKVEVEDIILNSTCDQQDMMGIQKPGNQETYLNSDNENCLEFECFQQPTIVNTNETVTLCDIKSNSKNDSSVMTKLTGKMLVARREKNLVRLKKLQRLSVSVRNYKARVFELENKIKELESKHNNLNLSAIEASSSSNFRARFLLQQLKAFSTSEPCWDDETLLWAKMWSQKFPESYNFIKNDNVLTLPSNSTLESYEDHMS